LIILNLADPKLLQKFSFILAEKIFLFKLYQLSLWNEVIN